ncbi:hypothetical protein COL5a_008714 [Colletotrichum fioriniae]|nr:hypothetical protein COL5a_008714 [Colletotrichum fioriniae]
MLAGFRVSSQICRAASTEFAKWIDGGLSTHDDCKVILIRLFPGSWRIDRQALRCILSVLHHANKDQYMKLDVEELLRVSETNLLLKCNDALAPWIGIWCPKALQIILHGEQPSVVMLGMLLKSADNFEAKDELVKLRQFAIRNLPIHFRQIWARNPPLMTLQNCKSLGKGDGVTLLLVPFEVNDRLVRACSHIWSFKGILDTHSEGYITARRLYLSCGRRHQSNAKACRICDNKTLYDNVCTKNSRVGEYFKILALQKLWPTDILAPDNANLSTISQRVNNLTSCIPHNCSGGSKCPLVVHLSALQGHLKRTMDDCARSNISVNPGRHDNVTVTMTDIRKIGIVEGGGDIAEVVVEDLDED